MNLRFTYLLCGHPHRPDCVSCRSRLFVRLETKMSGETEIGVWTFRNFQLERSKVSGTAA